MPNCDVLDVTMLAADIVYRRFQTSWEAILVCFELYPAIVKLVTTIGLLCVSSDPHVDQRLTNDCQLSSMIRLLMLISLFDRDSRAVKILSSVKF
jgi:hypothetical protein